MLVVEFCNVKENMTKWIAYFVYGTPNTKEQQLFWMYLACVISTYENYWLMIDNLNEILDFSKQYGGKKVHAHKSS